MKSLTALCFCLLFLTVVLATGSDNRDGQGSLRKSEKACSKFGPALEQKVFPSRYVQPGEYQHNAALGYEDPDKKEVYWGLCTGVLISEYYVLTAAHCTVNVHERKLIMVRLGNIDLTGEEDKVLPQDIAVSQIIVHPNYNRVKKINDIALLRLKEAVKFGEYVQPACLHTKSDVPISMVSTGWGKLDIADNKFSDMLLKSTVRTVDNEACNKSYQTSRNGISDSQICGLTDTTLCYLGSGSPIFSTDEETHRVSVVGLVTFGKGCGDVVPTVHTRIYSYLSWIEDIVWPTWEDSYIFP